jgi:hypothetical protein
MTNEVRRYLERKADGKMHLEDPLGEIQEVGGPAADADEVRAQEAKMQDDANARVEAEQMQQAGSGGKS